MRLAPWVQSFTRRAREFADLRERAAPEALGSSRNPQTCPRLSNASGLDGRQALDISPARAVRLFGGKKCAVAMRSGFLPGRSPHQRHLVGVARLPFRSLAPSGSVSPYQMVRAGWGWGVAGLISPKAPCHRNGCQAGRAGNPLKSLAPRVGAILGSGDVDLRLPMSAIIFATY